MMTAACRPAAVAGMNRSYVTRASPLANPGCAAGNAVSGAGAGGGEAADEGGEAAGEGAARTTTSLGFTEALTTAALSATATGSFQITPGSSDANTFACTRTA